MTKLAFFKKNEIHKSYRYSFSGMILLVCFITNITFAQTSYLTKENRISVTITPKAVYCSANYETIGTNDFTYKVKVENSIILPCFTAKVPVIPSWAVILDPFAYTLANELGISDRNRLKEVGSPNGWDILQYNDVLINKDHVSIYTEMFEDDKGDRCGYGKGDDGHCGDLYQWPSNFYFRDYPPNQPNRIEVSCGSYKIWFEFVWSPLCDDIAYPYYYLCDTIHKNGFSTTGNLCSNTCGYLDRYGDITFASPHINTLQAGFNIRYEWKYTISDNTTIPSPPDTVWNDIGLNKYYSKPPIASIIKKYSGLAFNIKVNLRRFVVNPLNGLTSELVGSSTTLTVNAITPTYTGSPITIAPNCNGGGDGHILVDISKVRSMVLPRNLQVSYRQAPNGVVYGTDVFLSSGFSSRDTLYSGDYIVQIGNFLSDFIKKEVGCPLNIPVTVPVRPKLNADLDSIPFTNTDVSCRNSNDGRIKLSVSGGTPPYKVTSDTLLPYASWARINVPEGTPGSHIFTGLSPSIPYNFAVTDSFNCPLNTKRRLDFPYTLTNPDTLRFQIVTLSKYIADTIYNTQWNVSCNGANNGSITAIVNEFTPKGARRYVNPPFKLWVTGTTSKGIAYTSSPQQANFTSKDLIPDAITFPNLYAGNYTLNIQDNNGCTYSENYTLTEPPTLDISVIDFLDNKCSGASQGLIKTKSHGGTRPYVYYKDNLNQPFNYHLCIGIGYTTSCDNGSGNFQNDQNRKTPDTIATLTDLVFGNHTMFVKDINGCISSVTKYINQPAPLSVDLSGKHVSCKGYTDGTLKAVGSGGTPPYSYKWSFNSIPIGTTNYIDHLFAGTYQMDMKDANNCRTADNFEIRNPTDTLKAVASVIKDPTCADREDAIINIQSEGGWSPKYFSLDGMKYQLDEPNFTKLKSGVYPNIHVKDGNDCVIQLAPVTIFDPGKLTATELQAPIVSCFGGSDGKILLDISGGNSPYAAGLGSTLTPLKDSIAELTNLSPGIYTVHISDSKNCLMDKLVTVTSPEKLQDSILNVSDATPFMSNGSATIKAFGGTSPYSYKWDNLQQNSQTNPVSILNLSAGFKRVIITDSKRCIDTAYIGINNIGAPVFVNAVTTPPTCSYSSDGSTTVNFTASTAITYTWIDGTTGPSLSNLKDGLYYVTATDANGLIATKIDTVKAPAPLEVLFGIKPSLCYGQCNGEIQATVKGGTQPYGLQWNDANLQTNFIATGLCEGMYSLDITDAHACIAKDSVRLINPSPVDISLGESATLCYGQSIVLDAKNPGSTYSWTSDSPDFTANSQTISITGNGTYYVSIVTPYGCIGKDTFKLKSSKDLLDALFYVSTKNFAGDTVVFVNVSYPFPESISWDFGDSAIVLNSEPPSQFVIFPEAGIYTVKMTAFLGECTDTISKRIKIFEVGDIDGYKNGRKGSSIIQSLLVYPNPNEGTFQVVLNLNSEYESEIIVHDFTGTVVNKVVQDKNFHFEVPFNLNQMSKGVYFVRALAGGESMSVLVTIQ